MDEPPATLAAMGNDMRLLQEYLLSRLRESGHAYVSTAPLLGTAGESRLAEQPVNFAVLRPLTDSEFSDFNEANEALGRFSAAQNLILIADSNYLEYENQIADFSKRYAANYQLDWKRATSIVQEFNRRVLNFLTGMRTFLDHTEARLKRTYGPTSWQFGKFRDSAAECFDANFSYRFVYQLRNFTQHCGMPLGRVGVNSSIDNWPPKDISHKIDFFFDRNYLLRQFDRWGKHVLPDLKRMPTEFPVTPHLKETMECLKRIYYAVATTIEDEIKHSLGFMERLMSELGDCGGVPCVYTNLDVRIREDRVPVSNLQFQRFPWQQMETCRQLLAALRKQDSLKSPQEKYAEGWDRIFGKRAN